MFATSAYTFNYLSVSLELDFEAFYVWFIFDRVWNLIPKMGSTENGKVFVSYFEPMTLGKLRRLVILRL